MDFRVVTTCGVWVHTPSLGGGKWVDQVDLLFFLMSVLAVRGTATYKTKKNPQTVAFIFFLNLPLSFSTITFVLISSDLLLFICCKQELLWVEGGWRRCYKEEKNKRKLLCYCGWRWWLRTASEGSRLVLLRAHKFAEEWGC